MTDSALATASITLPVSDLQLLRIRTLALAALRRIDLAREETHWASPEGRSSLNRMGCGDQDGVFARMDSQREAITADEQVATTIGDAILAAGCFLFDGEGCSPADRALVDITVVQQFAKPAHIGEPFACYWTDTEKRLREFLST